MADEQEYEVHGISGAAVVWARNEEEALAKAWELIPFPIPSLMKLVGYTAKSQPEPKMVTVRAEDVRVLCEAMFDGTAVPCLALIAARLRAALDGAK